MAAILAKNGRILLGKRKQASAQGGLWELPGGKMEFGETQRQCLERELYEELGITTLIGPLFAEILHDYDYGRISLSAYFVCWTAGEIKLKAHDEICWVEPGRLLDYDLVPADITFARELAYHQRRLGPWGGYGG